MYARGHAGLTLAISSLLMQVFGFTDYVLIAIFIAVSLSALPDIDMKWRKHAFNLKGKQYRVKHRGKVTHSLLFSFLVGMGGMILFWYLFNEVPWIMIGFFSPFLGTASHLLGDTFTYHAFQPLWPFNNKRISFGFCAAKDPRANEGLMSLGIASFVLNFCLVTGVISQLITV